MRFPDKEKEIISLLEKYHIDLRTVVVGTGSTYSNKKRRFEFSARDHQNILQGTAKYAIKYFAEYDCYLLWEVIQNTGRQEIVKRFVFSVSADDVLNSLRKTDKIPKDVAFRGRNQEIVRLFDFAGLENYIADHLTKKMK